MRCSKVALYCDKKNEVVVARRSTSANGDKSARTFDWSSRAEFRARRSGRQPAADYSWFEPAYGEVVVVFCTVCKLRSFNISP